MVTNLKLANGSQGCRTEPFLGDGPETAQEEEYSIPEEQRQMGSCSWSLSACVPLSGDLCFELRCLLCKMV